MKVFDCFLFFNELELLELRLMTLNDVVDYFVLVEANRTFTGNKKKLLFEKNRNIYKKYLNKIIHIKVKDTPPRDESKDIWSIERFQRNCITKAVSPRGDRHRIDEIPDPDIILKIRKENYPISFNQYLFYYYVNCLSDRGWNGSIIFPYKMLTTPQKMRELARKGTNRIEKSGWHYSYMGGIKKIRSKLNSLSDAHTRIGKVGSDKDILKKIASQKDLWDEKIEYKLINIYKDGYAPKHMNNFIQKYPNFLFRK